MDHPSHNTNPSASRSRYEANVQGHTRNQSNEYPDPHTSSQGGSAFSTNHGEQNPTQDTYLGYDNGSGIGQGVIGPSSDDILYRQLQQYLQAEAGSLPARIPNTYGGPPEQWGIEQRPATQLTGAQPYDDYVYPFGMQYHTDPHHEQQPLYYQQQQEEEQQQSQTGEFYGQDVVPSYTGYQTYPYEQEQVTYSNPQQQQSGQPTIPTHQPAFTTGYPVTPIVPSALPASSSQVWKGHGKLVPLAATKRGGSPVKKSRRAAPGAKRARKTVDTPQSAPKRQRRTPESTAGSYAAPQVPSPVIFEDLQPASDTPAHPSIPKRQRRTLDSTAGSDATPQDHFPLTFEEPNPASRSQASPYSFSPNAPRQIPYHNHPWASSNQPAPSTSSPSAPYQPPYHKDTSLPSPTPSTQQPFYHINTLPAHPNRRAAPYSHLPPTALYAPGITIAEYITLCTPVCGQVIPSKLPPGHPPLQVQRNYDFYAEGAERKMGCVICGTPFAAFREGERHFGRCVARNGNPRGWHWFDNEEFLAHRAKGGKGTQLTRARPEAEKEGPVRKGRGTRISMYENVTPFSFDGGS